MSEDWTDNVLWKEHFSRWGIKDYDEDAVQNFAELFDFSEDDQLRLFSYFAYKYFKRHKKQIRKKEKEK